MTTIIEQAEVAVFRCDLCNRKMVIQRQCCVCGRDTCVLCERLGLEWPEHVCRECWRVGGEFVARVEEAKRTAIEDWRDAAIKHKDTLCQESPQR